MLWFRDFSHVSRSRRKARGSERLLPGLQRQRHHREHGDPRVQAASELTPDYEVIVVNDGSADATAEIARRAGAHLSARPRRPPPEEPRLRRRAADRLPIGDQGADLLHRRRRAVRPGGAGRCSGRSMTPDVDLVNGYKISRSDPLHRIVIGRLYHHIVKHAVRPEGARRRLRLPADAAVDLRARSTSRRPAASSASR